MYFSVTVSQQRSSRCGDRFFSPPFALKLLNLPCPLSLLHFFMRHGFNYLNYLKEPNYSCVTHLLSSSTKIVFVQDLSSQLRPLTLTIQATSIRQYNVIHTNETAFVSDPPEAEEDSVLRSTVNSQYSKFDSQDYNNCKCKSTAGSLQPTTESLQLSLQSTADSLQLAVYSLQLSLHYSLQSTVYT